MMMMMMMKTVGRFLRHGVYIATLADRQVCIGAAGDGHESQKESFVDGRRRTTTKNCVTAES